MADYQDLTREELRRRDDEHLEARGITGWAPVIHYLETVSVRGADPVEVPVVVTERGPVVTGLEAGLEAALSHGAAAGSPAGGADCFSLRTPSQLTLDLGFAAFLPLLGRGRWTTSKQRWTAGSSRSTARWWPTPVGASATSWSAGSRSGTR